MLKSRERKNKIDSSEEEKFAYMMYDDFQATGAYDAARSLSDQFNMCSHDDDVQDFDTRGDQILLGTSEIPQKNVRGGSYKMKLRGSVQFQTVLAMYDPEIDRNRALPSYQRLKTMERQKIDKTIRRAFQSPK